MGGAMSDAEVADRIAKDDGPLDETVLLKRSTGGTRRVYHDAEDPCFDVDDAGYRSGPERVTRKAAQDRGIAPCKGCVIGPDLPESHDNELYERARNFDPSVHDSLADVDLEGES
jgi:hypothetical protein